MNINWNVRLRSPVFLVSFSALVLSFIYNALSLLGIVPALSEDVALNAVTAAVQLLTGLGILADPTTKGVSDSARAMQYKTPA